MPAIVPAVLALLWLLAAVLVLGYPLVAGRMRAGGDTVSRTGDPQAFWSAYAFSAGAFVVVSVVVALVVWKVMPAR